jgi:hypothetical protein
MLSPSDVSDMAALFVPIMLAVTLCMARHWFHRETPRLHQAVVEYDRQRLGDRRFSTTRLWFSSFTAQLAAGEGIETHLDGDDCLDLELISIQQTMLRASDIQHVDEDLETLDWLVAHFRGQLAQEEAESDHRPALRSCWLGFGGLTRRSFGPWARIDLELRLANAADLGRQAFLTSSWRETSLRSRRSWGFRSSHRELATVIREPDAARLIDRIEQLPSTISSVSDEEGVDGLGHRLLAATSAHAVDGPLNEACVAAFHKARSTVATVWGDTWWTAGPPIDTGNRRRVAVRSRLFVDGEPMALPMSRIGDRDNLEATT